MYDGGARLSAELDEAETRIIQDCLELQGIAVHNPDEFPGHGANSYEGAEGTWPDPPEDVPAPDDFEAWMDFETGMAVECAEESGYRDAAEHAWQQAQLRCYLDIEGETYAWQEDMRGHLESAQEVLSA